MKTSASTTALNPSTPPTSQKQKSGHSAAQTELTPTPSNPTRPPPSNPTSPPPDPAIVGWGVDSSADSSHDCKPSDRQSIYAPPYKGGDGGGSSSNSKSIYAPPYKGGDGGGSGGSGGAGSATFPLRIRGVLTQLNVSGDCEFRAQRSTGEPAQKVLSKSGDAKLYETTGRKPMMVAHLTTRADASDPVADLYDQLDAMAAKQKKGKKPQRQRGRKLLDEENALVTLSQKERKVQMVLTIDLEKTPDYSNELIVLMQKVSQCFLINQAFLRPQSR